MTLLRTKRYLGKASAFFLGFLVCFASNSDTSSGVRTICFNCFNVIVPDKLASKNAKESLKVSSGLSESVLNWDASTYAVNVSF